MSTSLASISFGLNFLGAKAIAVYVIAIVVLAALALYTRRSATQR